MTRLLSIITISTIIAFCMLGAIGCSTNHDSNNISTSNADSQQVASTDKKARSNRNVSNTDKVILRCGSVLTKTKKPCRNRVAEDSFCHLHRDAEAKSPTTPVEFLQ